MDIKEVEEIIDCKIKALEHLMTVSKGSVEYKYMEFTINILKEIKKELKWQK